MDKHSNSGLDFVHAGAGIVDSMDPIQLSNPSIVEEAARSDSEGNSSGQLGVQHIEMESNAHPEVLTQLKAFQLENAQLQERNAILELEVKKLNHENTLLNNKLRRIHQLSEQPSGINNLDEPSSSVNQKMGKSSNSQLEFVRSGDGVVDPIQLSRPPIVDVEAARSDFVENEIGNASGEGGPLRMEFVPNAEPLAQIDQLELNVAGQRASIENIFLEQTILKGLQRASSSSDLYSLRQISSKYYNQFNSPYWDSVNIEIFIDKHKENKHWVLDKYINDKFMGEIRSGDWEPEAAKMFRYLQFANDQFFNIQNPETEPDDQVKRIVADLRPHITTLQLDFDPFRVLRRRSNPFSAFPRLQTLIVKGDRNDGGILVTQELTMMELDEFVVILSNLPTKPNIVLYVRMIHPNNAFVSKLYNMDNTQLVLWFDKVQEFKYYNDNFSTLTRVKFGGRIELYKSTHPNENEDGDEDGDVDMGLLGDLAQLTFEHGDQMEDLRLELIFHARLEEEENARYQESLIQLSPFLTQLGASIPKRYRNFDIVSPGLTFPKLRHLEIDVYRQPLLGILNSCPMLKTLEIESNENFSFFPNHNRSDKKALDEHFKSLTRLEWVGLKGCAGEKFARGGVLEKYLKKILPPSCQLYCKDLSE